MTFWLMSMQNQSEPRQAVDLTCKVPEAQAKMLQTRVLKISRTAVDLLTALLRRVVEGFRRPLGG
jgi:hypothetical protein